MKTIVETLLWSLMSRLLLVHLFRSLLGGWRSLSVGASSGLEPGLDTRGLTSSWVVFWKRDLRVSRTCSYLVQPYWSLHKLAGSPRAHTYHHTCVMCGVFASRDYVVLLNLTGWIKTSTQSIWHELKPRDDGGPLSRVSCGCTDVTTEPNLFWVVWVPEDRGRPVLQWEVVKRVSGINPICSVWLLRVFFFVSLVLVSCIRHSCELCCHCVASCHILLPSLSVHHAPPHLDNISSLLSLSSSSVTFKKNYVTVGKLNQIYGMPKVESSPTSPLHQPLQSEAVDSAFSCLPSAHGSFPPFSAEVCFSFLLSVHAETAFSVNF